MWHGEKSPLQAAHRRFWFQLHQGLGLSLVPLTQVQAPPDRLLLGTESTCHGQAEGLSRAFTRWGPGAGCGFPAMWLLGALRLVPAVEQPGKQGANRAQDRGLLTRGVAQVGTSVSSPHQQWPIRRGGHRKRGFLESPWGLVGAGPEPLSSEGP